MGVIHVATNVFTPYGVHRDEFLYLAMGRHLQLWQMEFPPFIALLAQMSAILGDSLVAIRIFPALAAGALVLFAALIARELGGGAFAQGVAALAVLLSPLFLRAGNLFQPVVFDQVAWTVGLYALVRLARSSDRKWWLVFGMATGIGLLTKFSAIFFCFATLLALLVTSERRWLVTRWPWVALLVILAIGSPSLAGQINLGFPVLEQMRDLQTSQLERVTPGDFLMGQVQLGPAFLLAMAGLGALLLDRRLRNFRTVGWTCAFAFFILLVLKGKPYYIGPVYPTLFAAGGVMIESIRNARAANAARIASVALVSAYGIALLPMGLPLLPQEQMARYSVAIGATSALRTNEGELDRLPQDYADMLGWKEQVAAVAVVYNSLSPSDRRRAVVIAGNYGEAGAIDFYAPAFGLPNAISAAGTYWFFGPGKLPGDIAVTVGVPENELRQFFGDVKLVRRVTHEWAVPEERDVPIHIASRPLMTLQQIWPRLAGRN